MKLRTAMELGRISNLPSVWTNCLAGAMLANTRLDIPLLLVVSTAISAMYLGGMFLNDAFDANWDRQNKPSRPIARGDVAAHEVWIIGTLLLVSGPMVLFAQSYWLSAPVASAPFICAIGLATLIVAYNGLHKKFSLSPWLMGGCRFAVYLTAGLALGHANLQLLGAAACLMAFIVGLTYVARLEHMNTLSASWPLLFLVMPLLYAVIQLPAAPATLIFMLLLAFWMIWQLRHLLPGAGRNIPAGVTGMLAAIPLIDACVLAGLGYPLLGWLAVAAFMGTLYLQKSVAST